MCLNTLLCLDFAVVTSPLWDGETRNDSEKGTGSHLRHGTFYGGERFFLLDTASQKAKTWEEFWQKSI